MRFVLGGSGGATFGSTIGTASLTNSMISVWKDSGTTTLALHPRETNAVLVLGSSVGPVRFSGCTATGNGVSQGWYPSSSNATPLVERAGTVLSKRGAGTLVLSNVLYTALDGTGDTTTNFSWQVGSGTYGTFDGVVRETGTAVSNSLRTMSVIMSGGIMGLSADYTPVLGTNALNGNLFNMAYVAGAGFAAYGGKRTVTLTPRSSNILNWSDSNPVDAAFFMAKSEPLILSSFDADSPIVVASAYTNIISFGQNATNVEFRVYDNPATNTDEAIITMRISSAGGSNMVKTGAGTLTLTATNNDWYGTTAVSNGTLNINGVLLGTNCGVFVCNGATLGGTGTVRRAVTVQPGGTLTAGAGAGQLGTLTISSNLTLNATGALSIDISASGNDLINIGTGAVVLSGSLNVVSIAGYDLPSGGNVTIMTSPVGFSGSFSSVTHGYSTRVSSDGHSLWLHRDSPGFIFRIQ